MVVYHHLKVLSGRVPFSKHTVDSAVILAITRNHDRPETEPIFSPDGHSYLPVWRVASACWKDDVEQRIDMLSAHLRLNDFLETRMASSVIPGLCSKADDGLLSIKQTGIGDIVVLKVAITVQVSQCS